MTTIFEQQGGQYEVQGDYRLPCVSLPSEKNCEIGIWGQRHRRYLTDNELSLIIQSLISEKNALIFAGKYTDGVDDILLKILCFKKKKSK